MKDPFVELRENLEAERNEVKAAVVRDNAENLTWLELANLSKKYYNAAIPFLNRNSSTEDVKEHSRLKAIHSHYEKEAKRLYKKEFPKGSLREFDRVYLGYISRSKSDAR